MSLGIIQLMFADVCPTAGLVAHARSLAVNTLSRLKSIQAHRLAVSATPASVTGIVNVSPSRLSTSPLQDDCATPSSVTTFWLDTFSAPALISVPAATESAFEVA